MRNRVLVMSAVAMIMSGRLALGASPDAASLYQAGVNAQDGISGQKVDLDAGQKLLEQAAAAGSAQAMDRLGNMYRDADCGVKQDYAKALEWYHKEADLNKARPSVGAAGLASIGQMYENGWGVDKSATEADKWYKDAIAAAQIGAAAGDHSAMLTLAFCYSEGKGIKEDDALAWKWAIKATEGPGPAPAEFIAMLYDAGKGVDRNPDQAAHYWFKAAQEGEASAMVQLGRRSATGQGLEKDPAAAIDWTKKAVDRGNAMAMGLLGSFYHAGVGVAKDNSQAKDWYQKAIDLGDGAAEGFMGQLYVDPDVSPQDPATAMSYFRKGITQNDPNSMYQAARLELLGPNGPSNITDGIALLRQSADLGNASAMNALGELYDNGALFDQSGDAAQRWFQAAAEGGEPAGMTNLARLYLKNQKYQDAIPWLKKAVDQGNVQAMNDLAELYYDGKGVVQNTVTAFNLYQKAADAHYVPAERNLGVLYVEGLAVQRDYDIARAWFEKAAAGDDVEAMEALGELYQGGKGVDQDYRKAAQYYGAAATAQRPDIEAEFKLGYLYEQGFGVPQDVPLAVQWFKVAAKAGNVEAMEELAQLYEDGSSVKKDMDAARYYYDMADKNGSGLAASWLRANPEKSESDDSVPSIAPPTLPVLPELQPGGRGPGRGFNGRGGAPGRGGAAPFGQ